MAGTTFFIFGLLLGNPPLKAQESPDSLEFDVKSIALTLKANILKERTVKKSEYLSVSQYRPIDNNLSGRSKLEYHSQEIPGIHYTFDRNVSRELDKIIDQMGYSIDKKVGSPPQDISAMMADSSCGTAAGAIKEYNNSIRVVTYTQRYVCPGDESKGPEYYQTQLYVSEPISLHSISKKWKPWGYKKK